MRILRCTVGLTLSVCLSLGAASRPQRPTNAEWRRTGNRCQPHMPGSSSLGYEQFRRTVAVANCSPGAVAASRFVPRAMGGHRAARRTPDQSPTGIH